MKNFLNLKPKDTFTLKMLASDFIDNTYSSNGDCALARAIKRTFRMGESDIVCVGGVWQNTVDIELNEGRDIDFQMGSKFDSLIYRKIKDKVSNERIKPKENVYTIEMTVLKIMK